MIPWILAVLALFVAQTLLGTGIQYTHDRSALARNMSIALGPRDTPPQAPRTAQRAKRALANLQEALPVFLTLALLIEMRGVADGSAQTGAAIFLAARVLYVPMYVFGVFGLRSALWTTSWLGLGILIAALVASL